MHQPPNFTNMSTKNNKTMRPLKRGYLIGKKNEIANILATSGSIEKAFPMGVPGVYEDKIGPSPPSINFDSNNNSNLYESSGNKDITKPTTPTTLSSPSTVESESEYQEFTDITNFSKQSPTPEKTNIEAEFSVSDTPTPIRTSRSNLKPIFKIYDSEFGTFLNLKTTSWLTPYSYLIVFSVSIFIILSFRFSNVNTFDGSIPDIVQTSGISSSNGHIGSIDSVNNMANIDKIKHKIINDHTIPLKPNHKESLPIPTLGTQVSDSEFVIHTKKVEQQQHPLDNFFQNSAKVQNPSNINSNFNWDVFQSSTPINPITQTHSFKSILHAKLSVAAKISVLYQAFPQMVSTLLQDYYILEIILFISLIVCMSAVSNILQGDADPESFGDIDPRIVYDTLLGLKRITTAVFTPKSFRPVSPSVSLKTFGSTHLQEMEMELEMKMETLEIPKGSGSSGFDNSITKSTPIGSDPNGSFYYTPKPRVIEFIDIPDSPFGNSLLTTDSIDSHRTTNKSQFVPGDNVSSSSQTENGKGHNIRLQKLAIRNARNFKGVDQDGPMGLGVNKTRGKENTPVSDLDAFSSTPLKIDPDGMINLITPPSKSSSRLGGNKTSKYNLIR